MSDIVEYLGKVHFCRCKDGWDSWTLAREAADEIIRLRLILWETEKREKAARRAALEEAAKLIEEGYDRGIKRKQDTCAHGKFGWEDCETCAASAIRALKSEGML